MLFYFILCPHAKTFCNVQCKHPKIQHGHSERGRGGILDDFGNAYDRRYILVDVDVITVKNHLKTTTAHAHSTVPLERHAEFCAGVDVCFVLRPLQNFVQVMLKLCRDLCRIFVLLTTLELCRDEHKKFCRDAHKKLCRDAKHIFWSRLNLSDTGWRCAGRSVVNRVLDAVHYVDYTWDQILNMCRNGRFRVSLHNVIFFKAT